MTDPPSDNSPEAPPSPVPPTARGRRRVLAISLVAAFLILLGALVYKNSSYRKNSAVMPSATVLPAPSLAAATGSPAPTLPPNATPVQKFALAIQLRNAKDCTDAIPLFVGALAPGTTLVKADQERAWFWKGLCEYELKDKAAAAMSFQKALALDPKNASITVWIKLSQPLP